MDSVGFGLGLLLVLLGPLLLIPAAWALYRFAARPLVNRVAGARLSEGGTRLTSAALSLSLIAAVLALSYLPGKRVFDASCYEFATPAVFERVQADGFFRTRMFPYEAGPYLESFAFVEAPDPHRKGVVLRYVRDGDSVRGHEVEKVESRYGVREEFDELELGVTASRKEVYELSSNRVLARAAVVRYDGGPLGLLLGSLGSSSCPDIRSPRGSKDFNTFYYLETLVLATDEP